MEGRGGHDRRNLIKGAFLAGAAVFLGKTAVKAKSRCSDESHHEETLYRETDEFRRYYESLRD